MNAGMCVTLSKWVGGGVGAVASPSPAPSPYTPLAQRQIDIKVPTRQIRHGSQSEMTIYLHWYLFQVNLSWFSLIFSTADNCLSASYVIIYDDISLSYVIITLMCEPSSRILENL